MNKPINLSALLFVLWAGSLQAVEEPMIAIIIDDIGYRHLEDHAALSLPGPLTYAILPHTPGAKAALEKAQARGNEVMLHLPMESMDSGHNPGPGTLTSSMDWATFIQTLQGDLATVPGAIAINNHEGSRLTADKDRMIWLMRELAKYRGLAFVDSKTTNRSVAYVVASLYGLPAISRDIFLDHEPGHIDKQFNELVRYAKQHGTAVAIAHPHPETINYLGWRLLNLEDQGVKLVKLTRIIKLRQQLRLSRN